MKDNSKSNLQFKLNSSKTLSDEKKLKLSRVINTLQFPDIEDEALSFLFSQNNLINAVDTLNLQMMTVDLLGLLATASAKEHLNQNIIDSHINILKALWLFSNCLDSNEYSKILEIKQILTYGEDEKDETRPALSHYLTVDRLYKEHVLREDIYSQFQI